MRVLALEPFSGGSHWAFLDGWAAHSRHDLTVLALPPRHWKWRMRHAPLTFAHMIEASETAPSNATQRFDVTFTNSMIDVAALRGLLPESCREIPIVVYFHENQLTYPNRIRAERDAHFAYSNILSAIAANAVWFNSAFHRDDFASAAAAFLRRMPDYCHLDELRQACENARVLYPGCEVSAKRVRPRQAGAIRIAWAARWEYDKNPELLLDALRQIEAAGVDFRLCVMGEEFANRPRAFDEIQSRFADRLDQFGFVESRDEYERALARSDLFISTANHEFFGLSVVEALMAGAYPLLPHRLAYPEVLSHCAGGSETSSINNFLYDGSANALARRIIDCAQTLEGCGSMWSHEAGSSLAAGAHAAFGWDRCACDLDDALESTVNSI